MRLGTRPGWHMSCEASKHLTASERICTSFRYVISELDWMREFIEGVSMEAAGRQDSRMININTNGPKANLI